MLETDPLPFVLFLICTSFIVFFSVNLSARGDFIIAPALSEADKDKIRSYRNAAFRPFELDILCGV